MGKKKVEPIQMKLSDLLNFVRERIDTGKYAAQEGVDQDFGNAEVAAEDMQSLSGLKEFYDDDCVIEFRPAPEHLPLGRAANAIEGLYLRIQQDAENCKRKRKAKKLEALSEQVEGCLHEIRNIQSRWE